MRDSTVPRRAEVGPRCTSREMFLDALYGDFGAALKLLIRNARGDYTPDTYPVQFPRFVGVTDAAVSPWRLFELWVAAKKPGGGYGR